MFLCDFLKDLMISRGTNMQMVLHTHHSEVAIHFESFGYQIRDSKISIVLSDFLNLNIETDYIDMVELIDILEESKLLVRFYDGAEYGVVPDSIDMDLNFLNPYIANEFIMVAPVD